MLVVQAMVDSVGEKERLLRRSQQNLTEDAKTQLAEMDTLMADNSRLKRLVREKEGEFSPSPRGVAPEEGLGRRRRLSLWTANLNLWTFYFQILELYVE